MNLKDKLGNYTVLVIYKITLDIIYAIGVAPLFENQGLGLHFEYKNYVASWIFSLIVFRFISNLVKKNSISTLFCYILALISLIPSFTLFGLGELKFEYLIYNLISYIILFYLTNNLKSKVKSEFKIKKISLNSSNFDIIIIILASLNMLIMGYFSGFKLHLNLFSVYDLREEQSTMKLPFIIGYLQPLFSHLIPAFISYSLIYKKKFLFAFLCFSQLISFSFGGSKSTFFAIFIAVLAVFFYNKFKRIQVLYSLLVLNIVAIIEIIFSSKIPFITIFLQRRIMFVPNLLGYYHYDYFSKNEFLYLRESLLRWIGFSSPYSVRTPLLIGREYFNKEMGANTGMFGEAYSQFGWCSIFIYPILYCIIFKITESSFKYWDSKITFTVVVLYALSFVDGAFWSVLLTHGLLFICILFTSFKIKNKNGYLSKY